jgi:hypothetical protein
MMNGINFGGEGPVMHGTWYNPQTGDAFTVRDSFFEDNQYIVMTTDGRTMDYNTLQNYVQSDMKLEDLKKMRVEKQVNEDIPDEIKGLLANNDDNINDSYMIPEDNIYGNKPLGNIHTPTPVNTLPVNMNNTIIEKALKNVNKPEFVVDVVWSEFPTKQIEMLKDVMDIPEEEILNWYLDNIDMTSIVNAVKNGIRQKLTPAVGTPIDETPKKTTKTTKKTTKKSQPKKS